LARISSLALFPRIPAIKMKLSTALLLGLFLSIGCVESDTDMDNSVDMLQYFCPSANAIVTSLKGEVSSAVENLKVEVDELNVNVDGLKNEMMSASTTLNTQTEALVILKALVNYLKSEVGEFCFHVYNLFEAR
jgi:PBP1b-binding outer membrane lipoprotein LpoB